MKQLVFFFPHLFSRVVVGFSSVKYRRFSGEFFSSNTLLLRFEPLSFWFPNSPLIDRMILEDAVNIPVKDRTIRLNDRNIEVLSMKDITFPTDSIFFLCIKALASKG